MYHVLLNLKNKYKDVSELESFVYEVYKDNQLNIVSEHTKRVVSYALKVAVQFGINTDKTFKAALLHDISGIIPPSKRVAFCQENSIDLLTIEKEITILSHQKISKRIATSVFGIKDADILSAIACHTTLKSNPSQLDILVFIADKIEWDQDGKPPYLEVMLNGLEESLEKCAYAYLSYVIDNKMLITPHPCLLEAKQYLELTLKIKT